ncbi:MAG: ABC transporter substrate-binding protein [Solirubrobacterales bacterium]
MKPVRLTLALALCAAALLAGAVGCGGDTGSEGDPAEVTLVLDYLPNGVHAGIYRALASGAYLDRGIDLKIITPTSTADTIRLIQSGKADFGLADGLDIATQISVGRDARAVMAVTQRPSGGLITLAQEGVLSPADLGGTTVGVTGVPSDTAVFMTMVKDAGGSPDESKVVTVGFGGIQALLAGRISAFTGYIPSDAAVVESRGRKTRSFAFDDFGGPSYPGLVVFSTGSRIAEDPELVEGFVDATIAGYRRAIREPAEAISNMAESVPELDPDLALRTFLAYKPLIGEARTLGSIDGESVAELSGFMFRQKLTPAPFDPAKFGAFP